MGGYSQGAIAVHDAEVWLAANNPSVFSHVAGTLLLADPDRIRTPRPRTSVTRVAQAGNEGLRTWLCIAKYLCAVTPHDVPSPTTTANIVDTDDLAADFHWTDLLSISGPASVHTNYAACVNGTPPTCKNGTEVYEPELASAANWVASLIPAAKPQPGTGRVLARPA